MADYHAHPAAPITSHTKRPHNPLDYTANDGEGRNGKDREIGGKGRIHDEAKKELLSLK